jgi:hypothetical protein
MNSLSPLFAHEVSITFSIPWVVVIAGVVCVLAVLLVVLLFFGRRRT